MRGLFSTMAAPNRRQAPDPALGWSSNGVSLGGIRTAAGMMVSQTSAMSISAVYSATTIIATDIARCTGSLFDKNKDGSRVLNTVHPLAKLLRRPNRAQTWFEFMRDLMIAYQLRGNAYAAILRNYRGQPTELLLINPDLCVLYEAIGGALFYSVARQGLWQIAWLQDFPMMIPAEDIFHLRGPTFNSLVGLSTIGLARETMGLAQAQVQQQSRWVANGARPSVVLESPRTLTEIAGERLRKSWNDFASGLSKTGGTAVLEDGVTAKPLLLTSVDLQFIQQMNFTIQDIARFFNCPTRKLQQPDTSRGSTIIMEEQAYVNGTISPKLQMIEQKFDWNFDVLEQGMEMDLNEDELLRADPLTRYNLGRIGKLSGLITTNEFRRGERLPPDPLGNVIMQPVNMAALGSDTTGTAGDSAGRPPNNGEPPPSVPNGTTDDQTDPNADSVAEPSG